MKLEAESTNECLRQAWISFSTSNSYEEYCQSWLELMCPRIFGVQQAFLVLERGDEGFVPTAAWPAKSKPNEELLALIEEGIDKATGLMHLLSSGGHGLAFPIRLDDKLAGVVTLSLDASQNELPEVMEKVQWGSAWIEVMLRRHNAKAQAQQLNRIESAVDLLGAVLSEKDFNGAAMTFVNELAATFKSDRVSFGMSKNSKIKVTALSHNAKFGKKMNLIRQLAGVMDEAILQRAIINYNPNENEGKLVVREHAQFSNSYGNANLLTIPLHSGKYYFGSVTLERDANNPFEEDEVGQIRSIVALSGEAIQNKYEQDRTWYQHLWESFKTQLIRLIGPGYLGRKLTLFIVACVAIFFSFVNGTYRIAADSILEASERRAVVAPFEGYLEEADVKAGQKVLKNQEMSRLDDRDLTLEKLGYLSEESKYQRQYEEAVAQRDRAEAKIVQAQLKQNKSQLDLIESKLKRTRILAPFDGLIVSGDLSQRLGSAVEQGEVLFEVSPLNAYRVILWVDEHRMADLSETMTGQIVLNSLPEHTFNFQISLVTPVTEARDGGNYFRVEAILFDPISQLRPGMKGVGKVTVGERKLIWIWTYSLMQWIKLKIWSWWP
ncbi:efflux RND transporter periplasmic adaptor subunit [Thiomicrorhabdus sp. Milos-T2]|uniref:efflux RND transporter periplasmic adaptor subunit n=1 Tax=Thiomicrorhabdus sp. Milos-T2 TaxID=90814 RepID=UPI000493FF31|nr:efflux RND transporter periplasmic adaptor subunit [Thiomicrorhabdus sp. Milos-T2]